MENKQKILAYLQTLQIDLKNAENNVSSIQDILNKSDSKKVLYKNEDVKLDANPKVNMVLKTLENETKALKKAYCKSQHYCSWILYLISLLGFMCLYQGEKVFWYILWLVVTFVLFSLWKYKNDPVTTNEIYDANNAIMLFFKQRSDCEQLSYIFEQRVKEKQELNNRFAHIISFVISVVGMTAVINGILKFLVQKEEYQIPVVICRYAIILIISLIFSYLLIEFIQYDGANLYKWKCLAENAKLAEIENKENKI